MFYQKAVLTSVLFIDAVFSQTATVSIDWSKPQVVSQTTPTLQVVSNPLLKRNAVSHDSAWAELKRIKTGLVRFCPWAYIPDPAPIVEPQPPSSGKTYWNFAPIDSLVIDLMAAQEGRSVVMDFSTVPDWVLLDKTYKLLGDYFTRLLSWYVKGGFTDELGVYHTSGHHFKFGYWEAFNEPDAEGGVSMQDYCKRYDTLVSAMLRVDSTMKFGGPGLQNYDPTYHRYFLDPKNHKPGIPVDMLVHHWYGQKTMGDYFNQTEAIVDRIYEANYLRDQFRPKALAGITELGTMNAGFAYPAADPYWSYSGAVFAYMYAQMALAGGPNIAGMSQLMAQPGNWPEVSMLDWNTGRAVARARVLELCSRYTGLGDSLVTASTSDTSVFAMGFIAPDGALKALVLNKQNRQITLTFPRKVIDVKYVDVTTNQDTVKTRTGVGSNQLVMNGYATWVATFEPIPVSFSPVPGTYSILASKQLAVVLTPNSSGSAIYYTTDGTSPTTSSPQYSGPILISATTTIKALEAGSSEVMMGTYTSGTPSIFNGSFETPVLGAGKFSYRTAGAGWNFISRAGIVGNGTTGFNTVNPVAPDSSQVLFVQKYGRAQQFVTMNGGTYRLSLRSAQRGSGNNGGQTFAVLVDGKKVALINPKTTTYNTFSTDTFDVALGQHRIEFAGLDSNGGENMALVDMVSLVLVKEITGAREIVQPGNLLSSPKVFKVFGSDIFIRPEWRRDGTSLLVYNLGGKKVAKVNLTRNSTSIRLSNIGGGAKAISLIKIEMN